MTAEQPTPPAPPSPEARARLREENAALTEQLQNRALRQAVGEDRGDVGRAAAPPAMGVVRGPDGVVVITGRDGRVVRIDPRVVSDRDDVERFVEMALAPPPAPEPPGPRLPESVMIVGVVFSSILLLVLGIPLVRAFVRRQAAAAAPAAAAPELAARLARIEQAIEAVAIEVERISESERYSARLLTERLPEPLAADARRAVTAEAPGGG